MNIKEYLAVRNLIINSTKIDEYEINDTTDGWKNAATWVLCWIQKRISGKGGD